MDTYRGLKFRGDYMEYKPLGKLYYGDKNDYAYIYESRFLSEDTVKLNFFVSENQAFFFGAGKAGRRSRVSYARWGE